MWKTHDLFSIAKHTAALRKVSAAEELGGEAPVTPSEAFGSARSGKAARTSYTVKSAGAAVIQKSDDIATQRSTRGSGSRSGLQTASESKLHEPASSQLALAQQARCSSPDMDSLGLVNPRDAVLIPNGTQSSTAAYNSSGLSTPQRSGNQSQAVTPLLPLSMSSYPDRSPDASPVQVSRNLQEGGTPGRYRTAGSASRSSGSNAEHSGRSRGGSGMEFEVQLHGSERNNAGLWFDSQDPYSVEVARFSRILNALPTSPIGSVPRSIPSKQVSPSAGMLNDLTEGLIKYFFIPRASGWWAEVQKQQALQQPASPPAALPGAPRVSDTPLAVHVSQYVADSDFETLGILGTGSYGHVHAARKSSSGRTYAVKSMVKKVLKHKSAIHCALRELCCTASVHSPFVAPITYAWETPDSIKFAMPFCSGGDLERHLLAQPSKRFPEHIARFYAAEILVALKHLHQAGIIHRDIKASNILVDASGHVKLCDLGLSVFLHTCSTEAPQSERPCRLPRTPTDEVDVTSPRISTQDTSKCCLGCLHVNGVRHLQQLGRDGVLDFMAESAIVGGPANEMSAVALQSRVMASASSLAEFGGVHGNCSPVEPADPVAQLSELLDSGAITDCRKHLGVVCSCHHVHDDGKGWYKGRAGTPAYWAPEMLVRDSYGGRVAYGASADWWSDGCLLYALMAGRSPFSSGQGPAGDNSLTLHASPKFDEAVFSPCAADLIGRLLTINDNSRLGVGPFAWKDIQSHAFFKDVDWDLVEARIMPAPVLPAVRVTCDWAEVPDKVAGHNAAAAVRRAEQKAEQIIASTTLTPEDESMFSAVRHVDGFAAGDEELHAGYKAAWAALGYNHAEEGLRPRFGSPTSQGTLSLFLRGGAAVTYATGQTPSELLAQLAREAGVQLKTSATEETSSTSDQGQIIVSAPFVFPPAAVLCSVVSASPRGSTHAPHMQSQPSHELVSGIAGAPRQQSMSALRQLRRHPRELYLCAAPHRGAGGGGVDPCTDGAQGFHGLSHSNSYGSTASHASIRQEGAIIVTMPLPAELPLRGQQFPSIRPHRGIAAGDGPAGVGHSLGGTKRPASSATRSGASLRSLRHRPPLTGGAARSDVGGKPRAQRK